MKIAGMAKNSFVDYPGQIAAVVFTQGCNYNCFFCHNRLLIPFEGDLIGEDEVFSFLKKRIGLLDAVVITGGEPTMQTDLERFIKQVKELGYLIKLDTNGSRPDLLAHFLDSGLLDYVAMDYKAPFDRYDEICCAKCDTEAVKRSIDILIEGGVPYELRTTLVPQLSESDVERMLREIPKIERFALQHYKVPAIYEKEHRFMLNCKEHPQSVYENTLKTAQKYVHNVILR
jgi:pyruvate formate lyase activating enzyme